jgi:hypothetical protein
MRHLRRHIFLALAAAAPLAAQQGRISAATDVRAAPGGSVVAQLAAGTTWTTGATREGYTSVVVTAWVDASRFGAARDSFPVTIGGTQNLRIRETPSLQGRILGSFRAGAGLRILERQDTWARVRREVWVPSAAISVAAASSGATTSPNQPATPGAARPAPTPPQSPPATRGAAQVAVQTPASTPDAVSRPAAGSLRASSPVPMHAGPGGNSLGQLAAGAVVSPQARERGWVKVQIDAWVPESLFVPTDSAFGASLTAADLRADPEGHKGKVVRWEVQVVGMQLADPLRRDMARDEPFLLTMGPAGENATVYVTVPQGLITEARAIAPLTSIILTARIRTGRSNPTGAPILELISFIKK